MSGSKETRDDVPVSSGGADPCKKKWRGPVNSPKQAVLSAQQVGSILKVDVQLAGSTPILVVLDAAGAPAGSLTFIGYLEIIDCIQNRGAAYDATIINITGGVYEVSVEPK